MFVRFKNKKIGLADYLRKGAKDKPREDHDIRMPIEGDLNIFEQEINWLSKNKKWKSNYKHITVSLSGNDEVKLNALNDKKKAEKISEITNRLLSFYLPHRHPSELSKYIESHTPISKFSKNGERFFHWHCGLSNLDPRTGNQLSFVRFSRLFNAAVQSKVASEYNLDDPIKFINWNRTKGNTKISKRGELVRDLSEYLNECEPKSYSELIEMLYAYDGAELTIKREGTSVASYITVSAKLNGKDIKQAIRLRGSNFKFLNPIYSKKWDVDLSQNTRENFKEKLLKIMNDPAYRDKIIQDEIDLFMSRGYNSEHTEKAKLWKKDKERYWEYTNAQKGFWHLYKCTVEADVLKDSKSFTDKKTKHKIVYQPTHKLRLVDDGNTISTANLNTDTKRLAAIHLMLEIAEAKGWDLDKIVFSGDPEFMKVADALRKIRSVEKQMGKKVIRSLPDNFGDSVIIKTQQLPVSTASDLITRNVISHTKEEIERVKRGINTEAIIDILVQHNINVDRIEKNKKGHDIFIIKGKKFNSVDVLIKFTKRDLNSSINTLKSLKNNKTTPRKKSSHSHTHKPQQ